MDTTRAFAPQPIDIKLAAPKPRRLSLWEAAFTRRRETIGVVRPCYGSSHVVYGLPLQRYTHRTVPTLPLNRLDRGSTFFEFSPVVFDASIPLLHTWNAVPMNKDFLVSFELELPRYLGRPTPRQLAWGLKALASPRCKGILALSEFARRFATLQFQRQGFPELASRIGVFRGAIADPLQGAEWVAPDREPFARRPFSAVVIGTQLFRKGGMHAILAFERLRQEGYDVQLTLIGDFESGCYAFQDCLPDASEWRARARSHSWIRFAPPIPYAQVFDTLRAHDLCLYPSIDESLGWLPIEAGMLGVPVLGNRIGAFPEFIDHARSGWLVDLPLGEHGRWKGIGCTAEERPALVADANERIVAGIADCVRRVHLQPGLLAEWGAEARRQMLSRYGMTAAASRLESLYAAALDG